ncbi:uncharacterized protein PgNI_03470, partial [Pyricularia grisea]|uniref:Uncharacterized protein n=1 Tax=Pyricularia grisea TaxID=148305 RepID=A0A6P8BAA3_PYRGI
CAFAKPQPSCFPRQGGFFYHLSSWEFRLNTDQTNIHTKPYLSLPSIQRTVILYPIEGSLVVPHIDRQFFGNADHFTSCEISFL